MMSSHGLCCDECFTLIAKRSTSAAKLWLDFCEIQETCLLFGIVMDDTEDIQLLEQLRFITTTDIQDMIVIKVHGRDTDALGPYFCGGSCGRD